jgi:hypothetical protein
MAGRRNTRRWNASKKKIAKPKVKTTAAARALAWTRWHKKNPNAAGWHVVVYEPDGSTLGSMGPFSKAVAKKKASYMRGKGKTATLIEGGGKAKAPRKKAARRKASKPSMKPSTAGYALAYKRWHGSNPRRRNSYAEGTIGRWGWWKHANGTTLWQFLGGRGLYHFIETPGESVVLYAEMGQDVKPHKVGTFWSAAAARSEAATLDKHGTRSRSRSNPRRNSKWQGHPAPRFSAGDRVKDSYGNTGTIAVVGAYDDYLKTYRYKVEEDDGVNRRWWNGSTMKRVSHKTRGRSNPRRNSRRKNAGTWRRVSKDIFGGEMLVEGKRRTYRWPTRAAARYAAEHARKHIDYLNKVGRGARSTQRALAHYYRVADAAEKYARSR